MGMPENMSGTPFLYSTIIRWGGIICKDGRWLPCVMCCKSA